MRSSGLPNFRKTWGRIPEGLQPGKYTIQITNKFDMSSYAGSKSFVLTTTNYLGGKNYFLATCYLVVGIMCAIFAMVFAIYYFNKSKENKKKLKK
jgi:hypothetical protein